MAPRRERQAAKGQVDRAILAAAERLFETLSLEELTVGELAREAGVSRASFYFYFESKQAVLAALVEAVLAEVTEAANPWLERSEQEPEAALRTALSGTVATWRRHGAVLRAAVESSRAAPEIGALWRQYLSGFVDAAAAQIQRDRDAGLAPEDGLDAQALAAALIWMNERTFYMMTAHGDPAGDAQMIETLTAVWLRAVYRA